MSVIAEAQPVVDTAWLGEDAHGTAARRVASEIAQAFPQAGIAITGSVARGEHGPGSDLDVVVADRSFRRQVQFARSVNGVRTAVVCLPPAASPDRIRRWAMAATDDAGVLVSMVRSARIVRDPAGAFAELLACVHAAYAIRASNAAELLAEYRARANALLARATEPSPRPEHALVQLATVLVDAWTLAAGRREDTKRDARATFAAIREQAPDLYANLRAAVPVTEGSRPALRAAYAKVFGVDPPA